MGARSREALLLLAVCACALALNQTSAGNKPAGKISKSNKEADFYDEDYGVGDEQEAVLFSEDKTCPRDCICTVSQGYRIAKCNRLEVGVQKFGDDITDLVIENADPRFPIELDDFIFKKLGLHQAATVKIVNSTIGSVSPHAFHGLHELYAVNLSNNKLKSLHPETFATNRKLLLLTLANNPLKFPPLGSQDYFLNASSVQELDISYCNIQYITAHTFDNMGGLMYLNVAGNSLSNMEPDTFKKLLDLEELDLSDNNIRSLPNEFFSENTELATLHIQRNPIDTVYGLQISDLLTLNAGQTMIKFVGPSMFNGMTYIANLNLSGNGIEKIHNQAFHKLVELNYLDLSYNDLDFISGILIKENMELDIFKISNNPRLKHLPENGFECMAEQFNIYLFDASNCGLEEIFDNSLSTFTSLSQINLSGNNIRSISPKVFAKSPKLVEINLAYNLLTSLDVKLFEQTKELGKLNLQGNPLKTLSAETFSHTPMLTYLDVSYTDLNSLWKEDKNRPATLLNHLSFLNISHCRISEVKQTELESISKLRTLDISYNPLACSRDFENLMSWLNKRNVTPHANTASIANLARDVRDDDTTYSWDFLTRKVCGTALPALAAPALAASQDKPAPPVSDEEIWERIDEDAEGNFDLKDTLDDGKVADIDVTNATNSAYLANDTAFADDKDDKDDKDDDSDADDEADDADDDEEGDGDDGDDDYYPGGEDYGDDDNDVDLKVKLIEKPKKNAKKIPFETITPAKEAVTEEDRLKLAVKLLDKEGSLEDLEEALSEGVASLEEDAERSRYGYLWPILVALLAALVLLALVGKLVAMLCGRRNKQLRYNSAIIAAMSQQGRTKKDCGLVYQQLSEEVRGPATPKLTRYQPLQSVAVTDNLTYESSPFHHANIVPEAV